MKEFRLTTNITFDAEDLDGALNLVANHFLYTVGTKNIEKFEFSGSIILKPNVDEYNDKS